MKPNKRTGTRFKNLEFEEDDFILVPDDDFTAAPERRDSPGGTVKDKPKAKAMGKGKITPKYEDKNTTDSDDEWTEVQSGPAVPSLSKSKQLKSAPHKLSEPIDAGWDEEEANPYARTPGKNTLPSRRATSMTPSGATEATAHRVLDAALNAKPTQYLLRKFVKFVERPSPGATSTDESSPIGNDIPLVDMSSASKPGGKKDHNLEDDNTKASGRSSRRRLS
ncbi:hypothetical protein Q8F55_004098 [Vanrija albida]|uniref:Uncharacterized protein n=1 Tax=Vanrija albida TaxID=181172 RepID=A0ABR3Q5T8_9TREE